MACYSSGIRLPLGMPAAVAAVITGLVCQAVSMAAGVVYSDINNGSSTWASRPTLPPHFTPPPWALPSIAQGFNEPHVWNAVTVVLPLALFNLVGDLANVESCAAAGDEHSSFSVLLIDGLSTILAGK
jgi:hypothetical protein